MKSERNILVAFLLNLAFSVFELFGGMITGSVAILSDAVHDLGDACSIGISYFLEKKSKKQPDEKYSYGYARYSVIASVITTSILLFGSLFVIVHAVERIFNPAEINYNGMILFAVVGLVVNFIAAYATKEGNSLNQKAVNLHMLEDVLGWAVVLLGAVVMRFTGFALLDPILSIAVAAYILYNALKNLKVALDLFLEKTPSGVEIQEVQEHLLVIEGVQDVHHIHVWSLDGQSNYATLHIVTEGNPREIKELVRSALAEHGIGHSTLELEHPSEGCTATHCHVEYSSHHGYHHHHHHHHH